MSSGVPSRTRSCWRDASRTCIVGSGCDHQYLDGRTGSARRGEGQAELEYNCGHDEVGPRRGCGRPAARCRPAQVELSPPHRSTRACGEGGGLMNKRKKVALAKRRARKLKLKERARAAR